jgi:hypothetical protein
MKKAAIELAGELARLSASTIFELRGEWRRLHRAPPPMRLSRDLLIRGITYKLQERLHGGLSRSILRKLEGVNHCPCRKSNPNVLMMGLEVRIFLAAPALSQKIMGPKTAGGSPGVQSR